ncbi:MAG: MoaD/ThiS family protein [Planctomycetes bacterium]|nr:MoaD/ThiS family protein [Planctomycetota bacterium]
MSRMTVELPSLLAMVNNGVDRLEIEASTLVDAFRVLRSEHPGVGDQVFDESGSLRQHVLCFYNETNTRWLDDLAIPTVDGDVIRFYQAVSGG